MIGDAGMDLREAFFRQKGELRAANREISRLRKQLERFQKGLAATDTYQKQLSHIQGLNFKISELTRISDRYKAMYEQAAREIKELSSSRLELEYHNRHLQWQLDCLLKKHSFEGMTAAQEAQEKIEALSDEVARLTALLNRNGTNTGTPTSKTAIDQKKVIPNSREITGRKRGAQPGHEKHSMAPLAADAITHVQEHPLDCCPDCGGPLHKLSEIPKDEVDYEVRVVKKRHIFYEYSCEHCGKTVRSKDPALKAECQYGPSVQALALSLMNLGFVSINRTQRMINGLSPIPLTISEGYLAKLQKRYAKMLNDFVTEVYTACIASPLLYWDDTVVFINTARGCFRFYGNETIALYRAHLKKDLNGILDDNILPSLPSSATVMHDHNSINYHKGFVFRNVECLQHLERDLQRIIDVSGHSWAAGLKELIRSFIHKRKGLIEQGVHCFCEQEISDFFCRYDAFLHSGYQEYFKESGRYFSKEENALLLRLEQYRENYTAWVHDFSVPTTNNLSERALRFVKCKDKISGQFQNEQHAQFFAGIRTYIETCARNGANKFHALLRLTQCNPFSLRELQTLSGAS